MPPVSSSAAHYRRPRPVGRWDTYQHVLLHFPPGKTGVPAMWERESVRAQLRKRQDCGQLVFK